MSRSYRGVRLKSDRVYSVPELMEKYDVCRNTVTNWINSGLKPSDKRHPYVFRGAVVAKFFTDRAARFSSKLAPGEFKCFGCKLAVQPDASDVQQRPSEKNLIFLTGWCPACGTHIRKFGSDADLAIFEGKPVPNTNEDRAHEEKPKDGVGIGNVPLIDSPKLYQRNDREISAWQIYAERYSIKTQDRHLAAIREFEQHVGGKSFSNLTRDDVAGFRTALRKSLLTEGGRSSSTVSHVASHVRAFLCWLVDQNKMKSLPRDLASYLQLARGDYSKAASRLDREYAPIELAEEMLEAMPNGTLIERRARAIFALAFLGALRADTLISLQAKHFLPESKQILQDATSVRAKNGKSVTVSWFPVPTAFADEVVGWLGELRKLGIRPDDAFFPSAIWLENPRRISRRDRTRIPVMQTAHAASEAFKIASNNSKICITPHSAKHTIAALRDRMRLTSEQRKAWSENMGHETEQITERYYGKMPDYRRLELFDEIRSPAEIETSVISQEVKQQMSDFAKLIQKLVETP